MEFTIMVATAGQGILRSNDAGKTWHRLGLKEAIEFDGTVRALAVDPCRPERVYAGADHPHVAQQPTPLTISKNEAK